MASARAAYDKLTEDQKKLVSAETLKKLTTAEQQVKAAEESTGPDAGQDPAVKAATDLIDALPATAELKDKDAVAAARAAYDALTEDQKKLVSAEALAKLTAAEQQVKEAEDAVKPVKISDCKIVVNNIVYTGSEINKPFVAVKYDDTRLKAGTDYDISCNKIIKAIGTYKVTVKGKGRYTGKVNLSFKVIPMGTTFSRVKGGDKRISLKWKKAEKVSGYIIQYSLKKDFSNKTMLKIKNASTLTKTVKKLKIGKRYYVRIRTYFTDKKKNTYYSKWSEIETVSVKAPSKKTNGEVFAINAGETLDLKVLLDVSDAEMRWVSSDEAVATVSEEGIVNALAPGDVVITAIDPDGEHVEISLRINGENELELDDVDLLEIDEVIGEEKEMDEAFELTIA